MTPGKLAVKDTAAKPGVKIPALARREECRLQTMFTLNS